ATAASAAATGAAAAAGATATAAAAAATAGGAAGRVGLTAAAAGQVRRDRSLRAGRDGKGGEKDERVHSHAAALRKPRASPRPGPLRRGSGARRGAGGGASPHGRQPALVGWKASQMVAGIRTSTRMTGLTFKVPIIAENGVMPNCVWSMSTAA